MNEALEAAKRWLGTSYVMHPLYDPEQHPWHSLRALPVDLRTTWWRVKRRIKDQQATADNPISSTADQVKRRLRLAYGKTA